MRGERALKFVLVVVGLLFVAAVGRVRGVVEPCPCHTYGGAGIP